MCENASQPASNLFAEARGVLNRNRGRWPEADWQTLDQFVREMETFADDMEKLLKDFAETTARDNALFANLLGTLTDGGNH